MKISGRGLECELQFSELDREGWMKTNVDVKVPGFEGSFICAVEIKEWEAFIHALQNLEASIGRDIKVSWGNMEGDIEFHFSLRKNGGLEGKYKFSPSSSGNSPILSGEFEADQTFLHGWVRSVQQALDIAR